MPPSFHMVPVVTLGSFDSTMDTEQSTGRRSSSPAPERTKFCREETPCNHYAALLHLYQYSPQHCFCVRARPVFPSQYWVGSIAENRKSEKWPTGFFLGNRFLTEIQTQKRIESGHHTWYSFVSDNLNVAILWWIRWSAGSTGSISSPLPSCLQCFASAQWPGSRAMYFFFQAEKWVTEWLSLPAFGEGCASEKSKSVAWSCHNDVWFNNNLSSAERSCIKSLGMGCNFIIHHYIIISFPLVRVRSDLFCDALSVITSTVLLPGLSFFPLGSQLSQFPWLVSWPHQIQGLSVFKGPWGHLQTGLQTLLFSCRPKME